MFVDDSVAEARVKSIKEACEALDTARDRYREQQKQLSIARNAECDALNKLNDAQKAFDRAVAEIKQKSGVEGTDWHRQAHPVKQYVVDEVAK